MKVVNSIMKSVFKKMVAGILIVSALSVGAYASSLEDVIKSNESTAVADVDNSEVTGKISEEQENVLKDISENAKIEIDTEGTKKYTSAFSKLVGKFVSIATTVILLMAIVMSIFDIVYITFPFMREYLRNDYNGSVYKESEYRPTNGYHEPIDMNAGGNGDPRNNRNTSVVARNNVRGVSRIINLCSDIAVKSVMNSESSRSNVYVEYFKKMWGMYPAIVILIVLISSGIMYNVGFQIAEWIIAGINTLVANINNGI